LLPADQPPHSPNDWERWLTTTRKTISSQQIATTVDGKPDALRFRLTHTDCQRRQSAITAARSARDHQGLA
jgi:hypothetical protein